MMNQQYNQNQPEEAAVVTDPSVVQQTNSGSAMGNITARSIGSLTQNVDPPEEAAVVPDPSVIQQTNSGGTTGNVTAGNIGSLTQNFCPQDPVTTLTEYSKKFLLYSEKEFVETSHYAKARDCLKQHGCVTLTGGPGDGKTAMAARLLRLHHQQGAAIVALRDPSELHQLLKLPARSKGTTLVLVDDIFGTFAPNSPHMKFWREVLQDVDLCLQSQRSSPSQHHLNFIFTTRQLQAQEAQAGLGSLSVSLFHDKRLISLGSLDKADKQRIFLHHARQCKKEKLFPDKQVDDIASMSPPYGFPHICQLFFQSLSTEDEVHVESFFCNPLDYVSKFLDQIFREQPALALLLACIALSDGRLSIDLLTGESGQSTSSEVVGGDDQARSNAVIRALRSIFSNRERRWPHEQDMSLLQRARALVPCGESTCNITAQEVLDSYLVIKGSYVCQEENSLVFQHPVFQDTVCSLLGQFRPQLVVRHCSMLFLYERVTFKKSSEFVHGSVCLQPQHRSLLLDRFVTELTNGHFFLVCIHPALADSNMTEELVAKLGNDEVLDRVLTMQDKDGYGSLLLCAVHCQSSHLFEILYQSSCKQKKTKQMCGDESFVVDVITQCCLADNPSPFQVLQGLITRENCLKVSRTLQIETGGTAIFLKNVMSVTSKYRMKASAFLRAQRKSHLNNIGADIQKKRFQSTILKAFVGHEFSQTTLTLAVLHGANRVVEQLLSLTSATLTSDQLRDAFLMACMADNAPAFVSIASHTNLFSSLQMPLFILPSQFGAAAVAWAILSELRASGVVGRELQEEVTATDNADWTPLMVASYFGEVEVVEVLLSPVETNAHESRCLLSNATPSFSEGKSRKTCCPSQHKSNPVVSQLLPLSDAKATGTDKRTALMLASMNGHADVVSQLLPLSDAKATGTDKGTALMLASMNGHADVVSQLLPLSDAKATGTEGVTALMLASMNGHADVVSQLLPLSDAKATSTEGVTALMLASHDGHADVVSQLLPLSDAKATITDKGTALMLATMNGHADVVSQLLPLSDVKATYTCGLTALMFASHDGHADVVSKLLPLSDAKAKTNTHGVTALMCASQNGHADVVSQLLPLSDAKAKTNTHGVTALMLASQNGHADVVSQLLPLSDVKATDTNKKSALMYASQNGHADVVSQLLPLSDAKATNTDKWTALMYASENGHADVVSQLLPLSDAKATKTDGVTALMLASYQGHADVVSLLLPESDAAAACNECGTALDAASARGHHHIAVLLSHH